MWDAATLVGLTAGLIRAIDERDYLLTRITPIELAANVGALSRAVADDPASALTMLGDDLVLDYLATNPYLDASAVEAIITAGLLHAPGAGPAATADGLDVVARLVAISDDDQLNDGTKRGWLLRCSRSSPCSPLSSTCESRSSCPTAPIPTTPSRSAPTAMCSASSVNCSPTHVRQVVLGAMTERYRSRRHGRSRRRDRVPGATTTPPSTGPGSRPRSPT